MKYGYYLAHDKAEHGDPELSAQCRETWATFGVERPLPFDGVSMWVNDDGPQARVLCRDFFSTVPRVVQMVLST